MQAARTTTVPGAATRRPFHTVARIGLVALGSVTALGTLVLAVLVVLVLTQPVAVARVLQQGDGIAVVRLVGTFVVSAIVAVVRHL